MSDPAAMTDDPVSLSADSSRNGSETVPPTLEERVNRLEGAVASLQDTQQVEERVVARLSDRFNASAAHAVRADLAPAVAGSPQAFPAAVDGPVASPEATRVYEPVPQTLAAVGRLRRSPRHDLDVR